MIGRHPFSYVPGEHESERASNSYLMSLVALIAGLPLPIINLIATLIFFIGNRKGSYFVRWHCTQALVSQFSLLLVNSAGFYWTMSILFGPVQLSDRYIAYILTIILVNLAELIATMYTAIQVRKGIHITWWFYGGLTQLICKA